MQKTAIDEIMEPVSRFIDLEHTSGVALLISVVIAIIWANFSFESYHHLFEINFSVGFEGSVLNH